MIRWIFLNILLISATFTQGQDTIIKPPPKPYHGYLVYLAVIDGDTMPFIPLRTITIIPPRVFKNERERRQYTRLIRNLKKVLPYAKIAKTKLLVINQQLEKMPDKRAQKKYLKEQEKLLKKQYGPELTNLTISQGRLLIKL
ncbi:MAG TPA: DUF4294 domain-containing protein, partial [Bacteroidales bacterium]|nr:DUF4294 domain-containing protein [Bacteroidales bacterium]